MICFNEKFGAWKAMAGALLGMSIAFIDFDKLAWAVNMKSYIGFILAIVMFIAILIVQKKRKVK